MVAAGLAHRRRHPPVARPRAGSRAAIPAGRPLPVRPRKHAGQDRPAHGERPLVAAAGPGGDPTVRAHTLAVTLLDRHGVLTRGAVAAERVPGGFAGVYPVLRAMEESGQCRRGYFVEGLGVAQFALPGAVDRMRALASKDLSSERAVVLPAADPAQPYGSALPWPACRAATVPAGRPVPSSSCITAHSACTWSAAARRCCPGPTTRTCSGRAPRRLPPPCALARSAWCTRGARGRGLTLRTPARRRAGGGLFLAYAKRPPATRELATITFREKGSARNRMRARRRRRGRREPGAQPGLVPRHRRHESRSMPRTGDCSRSGRW